MGFLSNTVKITMMQFTSEIVTKRDKDEGYKQNMLQCKKFMM